MLDSWAKSMTDAVNTSQYAEATGRMLDSYLTVSAPLRKVMEQTMAQVLAQMSLPSRAEVVSIAERMTHIEMRLDDLDARLDVIQRAVERTASAAQAVRNDPPTAAVARAETPHAAPARRRSVASSQATTSGASAAAKTARSSTARSRSKTE
jgi:hypothetical protein